MKKGKKTGATAKNKQKMNGTQILAGNFCFQHFFVFNFQGPNFFVCKLRQFKTGIFGVPEFS
jgi:hypothetical protein